MPGATRGHLGTLRASQIPWRRKQWTHFQKTTGPNEVLACWRDTGEWGCDVHKPIEAYMGEHNFNFRKIRMTIEDGETV